MRRRPDHYSQRARSEGYQARSVYKLEELSKRFNLLRRGNRVLDLGAAPGSWTQFAAGIVGPGGVVFAVDLQEMPALETFDNVTALQADMLLPETVDRIRTAGPFDLVMSDAAPRTTGNRTVDTARSAALVEEALALCETVLRPGGYFIAKVFQGGEEQNLLAATRARFGNARLIKPKASRSESFETFLVGLEFAGGAGDQ